MDNCQSDIFQSEAFIAALTHPSPIVSQLLLVPFLLQTAEEAQCAALQQMLDITELALNIAAVQVGLPFGSIDLPELDCGCGVQLVGQDPAAMWGEAAGA